MTLIADRPSSGLQGLVATADHKRIAALVAATGLVFFIGAGILALLMRAELATPELTYMSHNTYNELFTIHGSTMIYLFVTPIAIALGLYMVPLQIGASDLSLSRLALLGYWLYLPGGLLMWAGFLVDQGAGTAGWFSYTPLSTTPFTPGDGMDFWVLSVILAVTAQVLWGISLLATIVRRRAPGMTMLRMPAFTWTMLVSVLMVVFSFPSVIVAMALLYVDRNGVRVYQGLSGWIDYQHLFWFYGHPVVYVMFFPFVGVALETVATFSRKKLFGYKPFVASMLAFSALSMAVWGHHMFATGQIANRYYALTSTALLVPAGVEYFDVAATMIGGSLVFRTPMLFAITFFVQFLIGGVTGIYVASPPLDYHVTDSYFVVAHFHYTLFAGSVFGLFAGIYYWFPKVTGTLLREGLGKLHFVLLVIGTNVTFFPMFFLGEEGMSRRVADYPADAGWTTLNVVETAGSAVIALAILVFLINVFLSLRARVPAGDDPWGGHTLEWATTSPPPRHNFAALPPVRSPNPVWDLRLAAVAAGADPAEHGAAGVPEART